MHYSGQKYVICDIFLYILGDVFLSCTSSWLIWYHNIIKYFHGLILLFISIYVHFNYRQMPQYLLGLYLKRFKWFVVYTASGWYSKVVQPFIDFTWTKLHFLSLGKNHNQDLYFTSHAVVAKNTRKYKLLTKIRLKEHKKEETLKSEIC